MRLVDRDLAMLVQLRRRLHAAPELSGHESGTARTLREFIHAHTFGVVQKDLGGNGMAVVFDSGNPGPGVLFRADLDALPIHEQSNADYRSRVRGVGHLCGHDGHLAILSGLALHLNAHPPARGRVILLFQPAEETGSGAAQVIADPVFKTLRPDYAFALHNLPGFPMGSVVWRQGPFAAASRGLVIRLQGRTAHAGEPEKGLSPTPAVAALLEHIPRLPQTAGVKAFALATVIHARLGEAAFGSAPGEAVVMATLRTQADEDMERLFAAGEKLARDVAVGAGLGIGIESVEDFPALVNDPRAVNHVTAAAEACDLQTLQAQNPLPWSEDFAHFTRICPAALFGLGAGENHPPLHSPEYDFPDALIKPGVSIFAALCDDLLIRDR